MNTRLFGALTLASASLLAACAYHAAPLPPRLVVPDFNVEEHNAYMAPGASLLEGQAFLRQNGGGVVTCAGARVTLVPATSYFKSIMAQARAGAVPYDLPTPESLAVTRATICDAGGNFRFEGLPAAHWLVTAEVTWRVGSQRQGGLLQKEVVTNGGRTQALLTDSDFVGR